VLGGGNSKLKGCSGGASRVFVPRKGKKKETSGPTRDFRNDKGNQGRWPD